MFCVKCGAELKPNAKFCSKCGSPVSLPPAAEEVKVNREEIPAPEIPKVQENSEAVPKKKKKPIALIVVLLLAVCAAAGAIVYFNSDAYHYKKNMKTANAFYEEGNYKEALEAYNAALEINQESEEAVAGKIASYMGLGEQLYREEDYEGALDAYKAVLSLQEDNADVYLGMSNAYIRLEKFEQAVTILQDGYQVTKDMTLKTREEYLMDNIVLVRVDIAGDDLGIGSSNVFSSYPLPGISNADEASGTYKSAFYLYYYDDLGNIYKREIRTLRDSKTFDGITYHDVERVKTTIYGQNGVAWEKDEYYVKDNCVAFSNVIYFRDSNGKEIYRVYYTDDDKAVFENDRLIGGTFISRYEEPTEVEFVYDGQGKIINIDIGSDKYAYSYDDQGRIIYEDEGNNRYAYTYNDQGQIKKIEHVKKNAQKDIYLHTYSYDSQGNLENLKSYENGNLTWETIYEYDHDGNVVYEELSSPNRSERDVRSWVYDDGKLTEEHYVSGMSATGVWSDTTYSYDTEGNVSQEKNVGKGGESHEIDYAYDMFGNVVYEEMVFSDMWSQESATMEYTNTYAFIGDLGDGIDSQDAEMSEDEEVVTEAEEADSVETASAEASDGEETAAVDETESSGDEDSDIAEEESEDEKPILDINVEDEVKQIREWFYGTQDSLDSYEQSTSDNVTFYLEDGIPVKIVVKKGTDAWDYAREYYYHDGEFYFAFIYNGGDEHRLYFKEDQMIRYIDQDKNTYDYGQTDQFSEWETPALQEAYRFLEAGLNE